MGRNGLLSREKSIFSYFHNRQSFSYCSYVYSGRGNERFFGNLHFVQTITPQSFRSRRKREIIRIVIATEFQPFYKDDHSQNRPVLPFFFSLLNSSPKRFMTTTTTVYGRRPLVRPIFDPNKMDLLPTRTSTPCTTH